MSQSKSSLVFCPKTSMRSYAQQAQKAIEHKCLLRAFWTFWRRYPAAQETSCSSPPPLPTLDPSSAISS
eukprot:11480486-Ditylum_brightwellii.AAC.1